VPPPQKDSDLDQVHPIYVMCF